MTSVAATDSVDSVPASVLGTDAAARDVREHRGPALVTLGSGFRLIVRTAGDDCRYAGVCDATSIPSATTSSRSEWASEMMALTRAPPSRLPSPSPSAKDLSIF